jgi:hypothetical protein
MSSTADEFLYEESNASQITTDPFISREFAYIIDMNNSNYTSNQLLIDTSSFSNSGKYVSYNEAYLSLPVVMTLYPTSAVTGWDQITTCNFAAGLKNGYWNLIDSMSVEYNNTTIIQLTRTSNYYLNYKMTASLGMSDVRKQGATIGFWPDTVDAFQYNTAASPEGRGISNNRDFGFEMLYPSNKGILFNAAAVNLGASPLAVANGAQGAAFDGLYATNYPAMTGTTQSKANFGFYKRQQFIAYDPAVAPYSLFLGATYTDKLLKSYFASTLTGTTDAGYRVWYITATIYLKHLHDFFQQIIPVKGAYLRFVINLNQGSATFTTSLQAATDSTPAVTKITQTAQNFSNQTCPVMLASLGVGQGAEHIDDVGSKTWKLVMGVGTIYPTGGQSGIPTSLSHAQKSVRLYAPLYAFDPNKEDTYLSLNATKKIVYNDIYQFVVPNIGPGKQINNLLSNGIVNPRSIIIAPFINADSNGGLGIAPQLSAFATEPATVTPLSYIDSFNVLVAGVNALMLNEQYAFQNFVDQAQHHWALNGGLSTGITSGLIDEYTYGMGYGWIVVNLGRRIPAEDSVPKSIQILGTNTSEHTLDYFCYIETQRTIAISLRSGELVRA